jgi:hypothetical protein
MDYEHWKTADAPAEGKIAGIGQELPAPQDQGAINIDPDLTEWLVGTIVGQSSFSSDLEETITTVLRAIKGDLSPDVLHHLQGLAQVRRGAVAMPIRQ